MKPLTNQYIIFEQRIDQNKSAAYAFHWKCETLFQITLCPFLLCKGTNGLVCHKCEQFHSGFLWSSSGIGSQSSKRHGRGATTTITISRERYVSGSGGKKEGRGRPIQTERERERWTDVFKVMSRPTGITNLWMRNSAAEVGMGKNRNLNLLLSDEWTEYTDQVPRG